MNLIEKKINDYFTSETEVNAVYIFGSALTGKTNTESDLDIASIQNCLRRT